MDINDKIAANLGLVYQQLSRFNLREDQDAESYAYEALYRAILTYNESAGAAFSTYAVCVIANELRKHLRTLNKKRQLETVSYDMQLSDDEDITSTYADVIGSVEDAESTVLFNELSDTIEEAFRRVYDTLNDTHRKIILMWYESECRLTQSEIAKKLNISQPTISKALSHFKHKLRLELEEYM